MVSQTPLKRMPDLVAKASEIIEEVCNLNAMDLSPVPKPYKVFLFTSATRCHVPYLKIRLVFI